MIRVRRNSRLSGVTVSVLVIGSLGLIAPAAVPASPLPGARQTVSVVQAPDTRLPAAAQRTPESLTAALEALAATSPSPDRAMILQAFSEAGFSGDSVEVSLDITPTGLAEIGRAHV